jgi:hypothetical protein
VRPAMEVGLALRPEVPDALAAAGSQEARLDLRGRDTRQGGIRSERKQSNLQQSQHQAATLNPYWPASSVSFSLKGIICMNEHSMLPFDFELLGSS